MKRICILLISLCLSWVSYGQSIVQLEYFFDIDPGPGNGTLITPASALDSVSITTTANTTGLAPGYHTFNVRAKYTDGTWGLFQKCTFYITGSSMLQPATPLAKQSFFFDQDPGVGSAAAAFFSTPLDSSTSNISLGTAALSPGFHTINVRAKNTDGSWGLFAKRTFYLQDSLEVKEADPMVRGEYFFDDDPGVGQGQGFNLNQGTDSSSYQANINTTILAPGFHTIHARFKDSREKWGLPQKRSFYLLDTTLLRQPPLDHISYYYFKRDSNHVEEFTQLDFSPRDTLDSLFMASTAGMPNGYYYLKVWVRDTDQTWSTVTTDSFTIGICIPPEPVILAIGGNTFCFGDSVGLITDGNHRNYLWSTGDTSASIFVNTSTTVSVTVDDLGCSGTSEPIQLTELAELPTSSVVSIGNDSLMSSEEAPIYLWYLDANPLPVNTRKIKATASGVYQVQLLNELECASDKSDFFTYWLTSIGKSFDPIGIKLYPNPGNGLFQVKLTHPPYTPLKYQLYNDLGQLVSTEQLTNTASSFALDFQKFPAGSYRLVLYNNTQWGSLSLLIR